MIYFAFDEREKLSKKKSLIRMTDKRKFRASYKAKQDQYPLSPMSKINQCTPTAKSESLLHNYLPQVSTSCRNWHHRDHSSLAESAHQHLPSCYSGKKM